MTNSLGVGGVETNLLGLADALARRGHRIRVVSSGGALLPELEARGIRHVTLPVRLSPAAVTLAAIRLRALLRADPADIVHAMSAAANLAALLRPRGRTRHVSSPMGLAQSDREPRWKTALRNRLMSVGADRVLAISEEIERALAQIGVSRDRLRRCPVVGIDLVRFDAASADGRLVRSELGIQAGVPVITTIGALHPRKRHDLFLDAAAAIRRSLPSARFIVAGEGAERESLRHRAAQLGVEGAVHFLGQRRDIRAILAATDVYVKPGIVEGFIGITVLEAMAAGVPVVAFDTRDVHAAVVPGSTGELVPRGDAAALTAAITRLISEPDRVRAITTAARALVEREFALDAVARQLEDAYHEAGAA